MKTVFITIIGITLGVLISMLINSIFGAGSLTSNLIKLVLGLGLMTFSAVYLKD